MALDKEIKQEVIKTFRRDEKDTGSPEVQIAILTKRISDLTEHLKINKKDHSSRLGLLKLVGKRKRLLKYFKKANLERFYEVVKELNIRVK